MPSHTDWLVPERVIFTQVQGVISIDDVATMMDALRMMLEYPQPSFHLVVDMVGVESFPTNLLQLSRTVKPQTSAKVDVVALACRPGIIRFVTSVIAQIDGTKLRTFDTLDAALAFLDKTDPSLAVKAHWDQLPL